MPEVRTFVPMARRPIIGFGGLLLILGCSPSPPMLVVDMRTDLSPVVEFDWAFIELYESPEVTGEPVTTTPPVLARDIEDALAGVRLAEIVDVSPGTWTVRVRLMRGNPSPDATEVIRRSVRVRVDARSQAVTVLITRDCASVSCPDGGSDPTHTACLGGRCVDPACRLETPEACPEPECASDDECAPHSGAPDCAVGVCLSGTCASWFDEGACADGLWCTPDGCVPRPPADPCLDAIGETCEVIAGSYLKASNTGASDRFGRSVALDGDTMAVGAHQEDGGATGVDGSPNDDASNSGAVYVFTRDRAGAWSQQAYLKASNTGAQDRFGWSVSLDGDTLAVGAVEESSDATGVGGPDNDDAPRAGAVYVFTRDGGGRWSQQAYLKASNTGELDSFGWSLALDGDSLAVGAPREGSDATGVDGPDNDGAPDSGAVYVFTRDGGRWSQQAYLKASNTGSGDHFGHSVAIDGATLAVGANSESSNATGVDGPDNDDAFGSGAVYVFTRDATDRWSQRAYLKASNTGAGDEFGYAVALDGDTLAVGAPREGSDATGVDGADNDNALHAGAVYVFTRDGGGTWAQEAYLKASNSGGDDEFGCSVSLALDVLVVGACLEDSDATGIDGPDNNDALKSGAVYLFARDRFGAWSQRAYLKASNTSADDRFGWSVALDGDTLAVGAHTESGGATGVDGPDNDDALSSGAVYLFGVRFTE